METILTNIDLLCVINEYSDLRRLCDVCVLLTPLKKHINYKLKQKYSLLYYNDLLFRNRVLNNIFNSNKQLYLNLQICNKITDVSALGNVHTLDLSYCDKITDVSALGNVHTLDLSCCDKITDVSALGNVHTLNLYKCNNITDVRALINVGHLYLP